MRHALPDLITIVGGGYVGAALAAVLPKPVRVTTRSGAWRDGAPPGGVDVRRLDVSVDDRDAIADTLAGSRTVVICYAPSRGQDRRALYVDGSRRLVEVIGTLGIKRLVYISSTSAVPDVDGPVDENYDRWPQSDRGRIQREGEQVVITLCERAKIPWCVLRFGGLYGPGRQIGGRPTHGDGMVATNFIHRDDAVAAVIAAVALPESSCEIIHVCDDDHCSRRVAYAFAAKARGDPDPSWEEDPAPNAPVRGKRVSNGKMKQLLEIRLQHPRHS